jgi:hypothetical protein
MTLSEVLYEAACMMSEGDCSRFSCNLLKFDFGYDISDEYSELMVDGKNSNEFASQVDADADALEWERRDFRTFMLLMASEAVK